MTFSRSLLLTALAASLTLGVSRLQAADECCPEEAGVKTVADGGKGQARELPPGHPPMDGQSGQLPPGHPPMGGAGGMGGMPPGHPPMQAAAPSVPFKGSVAIRVVQGTKGGPKIGAMEATLSFQSRDGEVEPRKVKLDESGVAMLEDLDLPGTVQPVVSLEYAGVTYKMTARAMSADEPDQMVRVTVFEAADAKPEWVVAMRHVMLRPVKQGLLVNEVLAVTNPTDRVWRGAEDPTFKPGASVSRQPGVGEHASNMATVTFAVPAGAEDVRLGSGFDTCCTRVEAGKIVQTTALMPGTVKYQFAYLLPAKDGKADLDIVAPASTQRLMVVAPAEGVQVAAEGLDAEVMGEAPRQVTVLQGIGHSAGQKIKVKVSGLTDTAEAAAPRTEAPAGAAPRTAAVNQTIKGPKAAHMIAGVGAVALVAASAAVLLVKPRKAAAVK